MSKSLRQVASGERARIVSVTAEGEIGRRLRDMGLSPGTEIEILGRAPLKDPVSIRLKNYTLTLRNSEADFISVEPLEV
jgi:ferrous iron transport protein A